MTKKEIFRELVIDLKIQLSSIKAEVKNKDYFEKKTSKLLEQINRLADMYYENTEWDWSEIFYEISYIEEKLKHLEKFKYE